MAFKVRLIQHFKPDMRQEFMELEKEFSLLEQTVVEFPKGKRLLVYSGREPDNTLIWECEFCDLQEVYKVLSYYQNDKRHDDLFQKQKPYILDTYTEIYQVFEGK